MYASIHTGEFKIYVELEDGCGNGYNSKEKKPEYVSVNTNREQVLIDEPNLGNSESSAVTVTRTQPKPKPKPITGNQNTQLYHFFFH